MQNRTLKYDIRQAIAWGVPDKESFGYTPTEFTRILHKALKRIEYLESVIKENGIQFTQTDWEAKNL